MFVIRHLKVYAYITAAIFVVSIAIIWSFGLKLSIDFTGGSLTEVSYAEVPAQTTIEEALNSQGISGYSIRGSQDEEGRPGYIIRTKDLTEPERESLVQTVETLGTDGEVTRFTTIGPVIGEELKSKAKWAIGAVVIVIVLYVAFAFRGLKKPVSSWVYGGITIVALVHDVLIPTAVMSLFGYFAGIEIDVLFVMAILAVLGYSVNDTIVVFDRVRENLLEREEKKTGEQFPHLIGRSIEQTLMRSINTSLTTILVLVALYVWGGEVTKYFALVLIAGVVAGAYSSIFLANPLLVLYAERQEKKRKAEQK